nr:hypothetical protein CFP56_32431 [Quercus suber]
MIVASLGDVPPHHTFCMYVHNDYSHLPASCRAGRIQRRAGWVVVPFRANHLQLSQEFGVTRAESGEQGGATELAEPGTGRDRQAI